MSSPSKETEEPSSSSDVAMPEAAGSNAEPPKSAQPKPPAKRRLSAAANAVIEISDTDSDDSDICAVTTYQATADEVKRIRGADYSSSSSSSSSDSYSSDSESPWEDDAVVAPEPRPVSKVLRAELNPRANRTDDPVLNPALKSEELIEKLSAHWKDMQDLSNDELSLTCDPFRVCLINELLHNEEIINNIVDDMNTLDWTRKKMDLYEFHQTVDLSSLTWQRSIKGIYELLKTEVMSWVSRVTGLELTSVSASCSLYGPGDHLLVHDDMMGDRRVAFILYLAPWRPRPAPPPPPRLANGRHQGGGDDGNSEESPQEGWGRGWAAHMGGALELLARAPDGRPAAVARRVYPRNNMLALFPVGQDSFHQVGEVVSLELPRLSINGWFHGPAAGPPPAPVTPPPPPPPLKAHNEVVVLSQWVETAYMSPAARLSIQRQMERASEVCLKDFLTHDKLQELKAVLRSDDLEWEQVGPANQCRYERLRPSWATAAPRDHPARSLLQLFSASAFLRLLHDCTDLALTCHTRLELQRWRPGDYTLLPPRSHYSEPRLEAVLYLDVPRRTLSGGSTTFLAPEDTAGALVTVPPVDNALSLVYCDSGAASFTKYLSKMTLPDHQCFYILSAAYTE